MVQTVPEPVVSQGDHWPIDQDAQQGSEVDGIDLSADQPADPGDQDRHAEVEQLGSDDLVAAVHEAQDIGRVIIGVHDQVCSLIKRNRAAQGHDAQ